MNKALPAVKKVAGVVSKVAAPVLGTIGGVVGGPIGGIITNVGKGITNGADKVSKINDSDIRQRLSMLQPILRE